MQLDKRIAYYSRKVAEYGSIHVTKRRNQYRYDRLMPTKRVSRGGQGVSLDRQIVNKKRRQ